MSLSAIDHLIELKEYSMALEQIALYIQKYPDQFDKAQKRVVRVLKARKSFNEKATELAEKMRRSAEGADSENVDALDSEKMDIIVALESSERNPALEESELTNDARRTVRLSYYINRSNAIMNQGCSIVEATTLDSNEGYDEAVVKFREGLSLKTNDSDIVFQGDKEIPIVYSEKLNSSVNLHIERIRNYSLSLKNNFADCQDSYQKYIEAVQNLDSVVSQETLKKVDESFSRLASTRNNLYHEGNELRKLDEQALAANPGLGDTSYITFSRWAVLGLDSLSDSGMLGAVDAFWNTRVESMKEAVYAAVKKEYSLIAQNCKKSDGSFSLDSDYSLLEKYRSACQIFALQGNTVHSLYTKLSDSPAALHKSYVASMNFSADFSKNELFSILETGKNISTQNRAVDLWTSSSPSQSSSFAQKSLESVAFYSSQYEKLSALLNSPLVQEEKLRQKNLLQKEFSQTESDNARTMPGIQVLDEVLNWKSEIDFFDFASDSMKNECEERSRKIWSALAKLYAEEGDKVLADFTLRNVEAENLLSGITEKSSENTPTVVKFYPSEALLKAQSLNSDIASQKKVLVSYRTQLDGGTRFMQVENDYASGVRELESVIAALDGLVVRNNSVIATSKQKIQLASKDANEARLNYQRAVAALNKNQFDEARNLLEVSRRKYNSSLSQQENASLRSESDSQLFTLDEEISRKQNEFVVHETRTLKDSARDSYYTGNFEEAENSLIKARTLWAVTNVEEDQEITNLLALVNTALSMKTGRVISATDPLYPEMSQILNIANQYYNQGEKLIKQGKTVEAQQILEQAKIKLRSVQLIYPLNQEASLLTLRIDRLINPQAFNAMFERKVLSAQQDYKNPAKQNQAYADLLDLQQINPNYKGLATLILNVEYELGVKQRPIDNSAKTRSASLTAQAKNVFNGANGQESALKRAVALLDQAISLNPSNSEATRLKDKIQTEIGGKATEILSASDEQTYQLAVQEMNRGNIINANNLVENLIAKNGQNKKLRQLQLRIKALM